MKAKIIQKAESAKASATGQDMPVIIGDEGITILSLGISHYVRTSSIIGVGVILTVASNEVIFLIPLQKSWPVEAENFKRFQERLALIRPYLLKRDIAFEIKDMTGPQYEIPCYGLCLPNDPGAFLLMGAMLMTCALPVRWGTPKGLVDEYLKSDPATAQCSRMGDFHARMLINTWKD